MDQSRTSAAPSKGEVVFRFVACAGIALALYYTPDLKWTADAEGRPAARIDQPASRGIETAASPSCAPQDDRALLVDAAMTGR